MIYVRHGESEHNVGLVSDLDSKLTPHGIMQAHKAAEKLLRSYDLLEWEGLVSPARRTRETAKIIQEYTGINFVVWPLLRDWCGSVTMNGILYPHDKVEEIEKRVCDAWTRIHQSGKRKIIIVSHASIISLFLQLEDGKPTNARELNGSVSNGCVILRG